MSKISLPNLCPASVAFFSHLVGWGRSTFIICCIGIYGGQVHLPWILQKNSYSAPLEKVAIKGQDAHCIQYHSSVPTGAVYDSLHDAGGNHLQRHREQMGRRRQNQDEAVSVGLCGETQLVYDWSVYNGCRIALLKLAPKVSYGESSRDAFPAQINLAFVFVLKLKIINMTVIFPRIHQRWVIFCWCGVDAWFTNLQWREICWKVTLRSFFLLCQECSIHSGKKAIGQMLLPDLLCCDEVSALHPCCWMPSVPGIMTVMHVRMHKMTPLNVDE